jgi:cell division protein FtsB
VSEELREVYKEEIEDTEAEAETKAEEVMDSEAEAEEVMDAEAAEFFEELEEESNVYVAPSEEDFEKRVKARKAKVKRKKVAKKFLFVVMIIAAFAIVATMCGKEIIKLKAENISLQEEQKELEKERDALKQEVENSDSREFIQEQIKKQMGLLNPGELLFTFDEEEE